jgi:hypothetical protein
MFPSILSPLSPVIIPLKTLLFLGCDGIYLVESKWLILTGLDLYIKWNSSED